VWELTTMSTNRIRAGLHPRHVHVLAVAVAVEIGLYTLPLPRLARLLGVRLAMDGDALAVPGALPPGIGQQARAMHRVLRRWPFGNSCLRRALVLGHLIRRSEPALHIGVRRDETGAILAHAWLEVAGRTLDPTAAQFLTLQQI
jgi:hypothetical protein